VLPLVPSYLSFVTGMGMEELETGSAEVRRTALVHSLLFVAGFSLVFMAMGASASYVGQLFRQYQEWIARIGGLLVVVFGLHLLGVTPLNWLNREKRVQMQRKPVGFAGTVLVGVAFGAGWTPCIGPVLGGILTLAATQEGLSQGVSLLGVYSAGLAIPFMLSAVALTKFLEAFERMKKYVRYVEWASGGLLILVGLLLLSGQFTVMAAWAAKFTPEFILERI